MTAELSREVVRAALPDLITGPGKTTHPALHMIWFRGRSERWQTFEQDAMQHFQQTDWNRHRRVLTYRPANSPSPASIAREHFICGDEAGVQGRFNQHIGQVMSAVSVAMGIDLAFADYKANTSRTVDSKVPDIICMTRSGGLRIIGEIKTPWIKAHDIQRAMIAGGTLFEQILGK
jgi:hypothetical protein